MTIESPNHDTLRVAFFPDCYREVDGVANTSRQFEAFAIRRSLPFLTIFGGNSDRTEHIGPVTRMELSRSRCRFAVDKKHDFDLAFLRYFDRVETAVRDFRPDIVHITGPSDVGILGTLMADRLRVPLAASWHTNLHQYAEQRAVSLLGWLPSGLAQALGQRIREASLRATLSYYHIAKILFAPNRELIELIEKGTGKPCYLMQRGVDTVFFDPARRSRTDDGFVIGYVGRLTVEKSVRFLVDLERELIRLGVADYRFLIVGQGSEEAWLRAHLRNAEFTGILTGEPLGRAYANMDVFAFPSRTDTYGNVVLEALASGVPAVVTNSGGPQFIVHHGENGFVTSDLLEFAACVECLIRNPARLAAMRRSARAFTLSASWDIVFDSVYEGYERGLRSSSVASRNVRMHRVAGSCHDATGLL